ncbi:MAG: hypothetical protein ABJH45_15615 [Paracoccaceae bacterium]|uniref:hypothetical protein n=1 Tax=Alphaproteobacteria TaxID=28211 RepID=UPI0032992A27
MLIAAFDKMGSLPTCGGAAARSQRFRTGSQPPDDSSQPLGDIGFLNGVRIWSFAVPVGDFGKAGIGFSKILSGVCIQGLCVHKPYSQIIHFNQ